MSILAYKNHVLEILIENLKNSQPEVVHSRHIADQLNISEKETCQLIKIMNEKGLVTSDIEGMKALITKEGLRSARLCQPGEPGPIYWTV